MEGLPTPAADTTIGTGLMSMFRTRARLVHWAIGSDVAAVTILTLPHTVQATSRRPFAAQAATETIHDAAALPGHLPHHLKDGTERPRPTTTRSPRLHE